MDETPVWSDMISNTTIDTTGSNIVTVKSTGHEKSCVSVCRVAKADGSRWKTRNHCKEFKNCVIDSSANTWMHTELNHV